MRIRKYIGIFGLLLAAFGTLQAQNIGQPHRISGLLLNDLDSSRVYGAHVINIRGRTVVASNANGVFEIHASPGDTLKISAVGFEQTIVPALYFVDNSQKTKKLFLKTKPQMIQEVQAHSYMAYSDFKKAFVQLDLPDTTRKITLNLPKIPKGAGLEPGSVMIDPFTLLYLKYNKRDRDRRAYQALLARDKYKARIREKYNPQLVKHVTHLTNDELVKAFMKYCALEDKFIEKATDYELALAISNCYAEFNQHDSSK